MAGHKPFEERRRVRSPMSRSSRFIWQRPAIVIEIAGSSPAMTSLLVLAMRSAPESSSRGKNSLLSAPIFARECRRWLPASHDLRFEPRSRRKESKEAERRQTRILPPHLAVRRAQSAARSPLGVPPRLYANGTIHPKAQPGPGFVTHGPNAAGSPPARVALPAMHLARGHSAGRLMPRPPGSGSDEPPPAGTASRSAMRGHRITSLYVSEIDGHFSKRHRDVKAFLFVQINRELKRVT